MITISVGDRVIWNPDPKQLESHTHPNRAYIGREATVAECFQGDFATIVFDDDFVIPLVPIEHLAMILTK